MLRVDTRTPARMLRHVRLFVLKRHFAPRHAIVFQTERATRAVGVQMRAQIFVGRVPADITIELAVIGIARIADDRTPDLLTGLHVARENRARDRADRLRARDARSRASIQSTCARSHETAARYGRCDQALSRRARSDYRGGACSVLARADRSTSRRAWARS